MTDCRFTRASCSSACGEERGARRKERGDVSSGALSVTRRRQASREYAVVQNEASQLTFFSATDSSAPCSRWFALKLSFTRRRMYERTL